MDHQNEKPTGASQVELTPDVLSALQKGLSAHRERKQTVLPDLVADCPYGTYLAVVTFVFEQIVAHAQANGTYQELIHDRLGFGPEAYVPLYLAGGMDISTGFVLPVPPEEEEELRLSAALDEVIRDQPLGELRSTLIDLMFRLAELGSFSRIAKSIIERQRRELDALAGADK